MVGLVSVSPAALPLTAAMMCARVLFLLSTVAVLMVAVDAQGTISGLSRFFTCRGNYLMDTTGRVIIDTGTVLAGKDPEQVKALLIKFCLSTKTHLQVWRRLNPQGLEYRMVWEYVHTATVPEIASNGVVITLPASQQFTATSDDRLGLWSPLARKFSIPYSFHASRHQMYRSDFAFAENYDFNEGSTIRLDPLKWPWSFTLNIGLCLESDCSDFRQVSLNPTGIVYLGLTRPVFRNTVYGRIEGTTITLHNSKIVHSFLGVRYAKSPTGARRFAKPQEPEDHGEIFDATAQGPACPQNSDYLSNKHPGWNYFDEDCLHLNVFEPAEGDRPLPVLVWFHSPSYQQGANIEYPGHFMAAKGAVVVVPNFRLGVMGFASTEDDAAAGNWGLWDQRMALLWVRDNIGHFGGDANNVTIGGSTSSSGFHLVSPQSKGLFHKAILDSANDLMFLPKLHPLVYVEQIARNDSVRCPTDNSLSMVNCLRTKPWQQLIAIRLDCLPGELCLDFKEVVDGPGGFLPKTPMEMRAAGDFANVPLLAGINAQDGLSIVLSSPVRAQFLRDGLDRATFELSIRNIISAFAARNNLDQTRRENVFQALKYVYSNPPFDDDKESNARAVVEMLTDLVFGQTIDLVCKMQAERDPVYQYVFAYRRSGLALPAWIRAPRSAVVPFIRGQAYLPLNPLIARQLRMGDNTGTWSDEDMKMTEYIQTLWYNFIKKGNPTPTPMKAPDGEDITWSPQTNRLLNYLYMDWSQSLHTNYRQKYYSLWTKYFPYLSGGLTFFGVNLE